MIFSTEKHLLVLCFMKITAVLKFLKLFHGAFFLSEIVPIATSTDIFINLRHIYMILFIFDIFINISNVHKSVNTLTFQEHCTWDVWVCAKTDYYFIEQRTRKYVDTQIKL